MKKFMLLASAMVLMFATSCLKEEAAPSNSTPARYQGKYTVTQKNTDKKFEFPNVEIAVEIPNASEPIFDITFKNLTFAPGSMPPMDILISNIPFETTISEDENCKKYIFTAYDRIPKIGDVEYSQYQVKEIKGSIGLEVIIRFEVYNVQMDSTYIVEFTNVPNQGGGEDNNQGGNGGNNQGGGDTPNPTDDIKGKYVVTNTSAGTTTESANVAIDVSFADGSNSTMDITFKGLSFVPGSMPEMDIVVPNIPYTVVEGVVYNLEGNGIIPQVQGVGYQQYLISEIKGSIGSTVTIEFTLSQMPYKVKFTNQE